MRVNLSRRQTRKARSLLEMEEVVQVAGHLFLDMFLGILVPGVELIWIYAQVLYDLMLLAQQ
jgi:hypothetical protein